MEIIFFSMIFEQRKFAHKLRIFHFELKKSLKKVQNSRFFLMSTKHNFYLKITTQRNTNNDQNSILIRLSAC